jgi:hypothetical protein
MSIKSNIFAALFTKKFIIMALPIRGIPVLEGAAARRFLREAKKAEKERGTIKFSEESIASYRRIVADYQKNVLDKQL